MKLYSKTYLPHCMATWIAAMLTAAADSSSVESGSSRDAKRVTLSSLISEMTDYGSVASWPSPAFRCIQASSHDRRTVSHDQDGWFANDDHTQFIRDEVNGGRKERVMMDETGPGCIVRFWLTTVQNKSGTIRIYLDGAAEPTLEFPAYDLMQGDLGLKDLMVIPHPGYTPDGNGGNTLMFPILYQESCKVTWEEKGAGPRYYLISHRKYEQGTKVETFSQAVLEKNRASILQAGEQLLSPPAIQGRLSGEVTTLAAGKELSLELPAGSAALRSLRLKVTPEGHADSAKALRSVIVKMEFDGAQTVWCPAGDFFGSGAGLNELQSWYRTVEQSGMMECRWVMPYEKSARITLENVGDLPATIDVSYVTSPWKWDDRSMHFHTAWHYEGGLRTRPPRDWNYINLEGRGVYVGDTLSLFNEAPTWYGEGDEKIRVDGESVPSHLGTGTEDYYGYSFAPRGIMQTPFANQIRVDEKMTQGHNILNRSRNLDSIPYQKSLDFDIELISWAPTRMIYAATTHWYAFSGGQSNRVPDVAGAKEKIPTLQDAQSPPAAFDGAVDAEDLKLVSSTQGMITEKQDMQGFGWGMWSKGAQLLARGGSVGDGVVLELSASDNQSRELLMAATRAPDYGILSIKVNGKRVVKKFDGYAPEVAHSGEVSLGAFAPVDGKYRIEVKVSGANDAATGSRYYFGLDYFLLRKP